MKLQFEKMKLSVYIENQNVPETYCKQINMKDVSGSTGSKTLQGCWIIQPCQFREKLCKKIFLGSQYSAKHLDAVSSKNTTEGHSSKNNENILWGLLTEIIYWKTKALTFLNNVAVLFLFGTCQLGQWYWWHNSMVAQLLAREKLGGERREAQCPPILVNLLTKLSTKCQKSWTFWPPPPFWK